MRTSNREIKEEDGAAESPEAEGLKDHRLVALAELAIAAALVTGANVFDIVPVSETPWLVLIGWVSIRLRGSTWKRIGLIRPSRWIKTFSLALLAAVLLQLFSEFVVEPIAGRPDLSSFRDLEGNLSAAGLMLVLIWVFAAFGEELAYRGYVLDRAASIGNYSRNAYLFSVVTVSLLFGLGHFYQGPSGIAGSAVSGLFFGLLYVYSGRNLWLPILTHGFSDTIGLALIYFGFAPGL